MMIRNCLFFAAWSIGAAVAAQSPVRVWDETEILQAVERNSPALQRAAASAQAERLQARTGNALSDPELGYTHTWGSSGAAGENEYTVTQGFDFPTAYVQRGRIARAKEHSADMAYREVRTEVLLQARLAVQRIVYLERRMTVDSLRLADALFARDIAFRRAEAGDITAIEENRIELQAVSARNNLVRSSIALEAARTELSVLSGIPERELVGIRPASLPPLPPLEQILERACTDDPRLCGVRAAQSAAVAERRLAVSLALPRFSAGYKHSDSDGLKFNGVVVGMSLPLFQSRNTVRLARARQAETEALSDEVETALKADIRSRYSQARRLEALYASYRSDASWDEKSALLRKALEAESMTVLEYFTELDPVYRNMDELNELTYNYRSSLIELEKYAL